MRQTAGALHEAERAASTLPLGTGRVLGGAVHGGARDQITRGAPSLGLMDLSRVKVVAGATNLRCLLLIAVVGCTAKITGSSERSSGTGPGASPVTGAPGESPGNPVFNPTSPFAGGDGNVRDGAGARPLRRLTRVEYDNTVRDLLGVATTGADDLPADVADSSGFETGPNVSSVEAAAFLLGSEAVGEQVRNSLDAILPCAAAPADEEGCVGELLTTFAKRAFRRPLFPVERNRLMDLFGALRTTVQHDFRNSVVVLVQAILQAPQVLYHWEVGSEKPETELGFIKLTPYEVASRLSYAITQTLPDAELSAAADAGRLGSGDEVEKQARRLLALARARNTGSDFVEQWLGLRGLALASKDVAQFPGFGTELAEDMREETRAFVASVLFDGDGRFGTLLTAPYSFLNERLATVYGRSGINGDALVRADLGAERAGLLTQLSVLTVNATAKEGSPIKRGRLVRERFLCQHLPPPPQDVPPLAPITPGLPTRQHFLEHSENPSCKACHELMDPVGFGFLHYDAIGAYQTMDGNQPVDATGWVSEIDGLERVDFNGVRELADILAKSPEVRQCMTRQLFRYAVGRKELSEDGGSLSAELAKFETTDGVLTDALVAITRTNAFRYRAPAAGENYQ